MASMQLSRFTFNFTELYKRCPRDQLNNLKALHAKNLEYKKKLETLGEKPPTIDWEYYKRNVRVEYVTMVEQFQEKFSNLEVPYPDGEKYFKQLEEIKTQVKGDIDKFVKESNARIKSFEDEISRIKSMLPYSEMTLEEFYILCPEKAPRLTGENASFWPHTPEEQLDYVDPDANLYQNESKAAGGSKDEIKSSETNKKNQKSTKNIKDKKDDDKKPSEPK